LYSIERLIIISALFDLRHDKGRIFSIGAAFSQIVDHVTDQRKTFVTVFVDLFFVSNKNLWSYNCLLNINSSSNEDDVS